MGPPLPALQTLTTVSIVERQPFANGYLARGTVGGINEGKGRRRVLAQKFARIEQQAAAQPFRLKQMGMAATDQVEVAGGRQGACPAGIVLDGDAPGTGNQGAVPAVMGEVMVLAGAAQRLAMRCWSPLLLP